VRSEYDRIAEQLAVVIGNTLTRFRSELNEPISIVALDFHPWHGRMALAVLTESELARESRLVDANMVSSWNHYDIGAGYAEWQPAQKMATAMESLYVQTQDANILFQCCASALGARPAVKAALRSAVADDFQMRVVNADDQRDYFVHPSLIMIRLPDERRRWVKQFGYRLHDEVRTHIRNAPKTFNHAKLLIDVQRASSVESNGGRQINISVLISGTLNNLPVNYRWEYDRHYSNFDSSDLAAFMAGGVVGYAAARAVKATGVFDAIASNTASQEDVHDRFLFEILDHLDKTVGRTESNNDTLWHRVRRVGWLAMIPAALISIIVFWWRLQANSADLPPFLIVIFGAALGLPAVLIVHCIGLCWLPDAFFLNETKGKRMMSSLGVATPRQLRWLAAFLALVTAAASLGIWRALW